jgi:oxalate decarboxylase
MPVAHKPSKRASNKRASILAKAVSEPTRKSAPVAKGKLQRTLPQPKRPRRGGTDPGPRDAVVDAQNPDLFIPPKTDDGILPNLRFSFADAHMRLERGGWTREITVRELPISTNMAGVDMRLNAGAIREMHWHKEAEWAYMLYGSARVSIVDEQGRFFIGDVGVGDLWYFPPGLPHSIQGLGPDGCEFLLVFDDGSFSEDNTFLLSDWVKHTPAEVMAKNFGVPAKSFARVPDPDQLYIFAGKVPPALSRDRDRKGVTPTPLPYIHRMLAQKPIKTKSGTARITDSTNFPVATAIAAALVEVEPGGMRELHWHPNTDEWQYYIEGQARMGVFGSTGNARTFDYRAGDVGYVPFAMGHYVENTGRGPLRFLEMFKSSRFADVSLNQWLALTPPELVRASLDIDEKTVRALHKKKSPVVPA